MAQRGGYAPPQAYNGQPRGPPGQGQSYSQQSYDQHYDAPDQGGQYEQYQQGNPYAYDQNGYNDPYAQQDYARQPHSAPPTNGANRAYAPRNNGYAQQGDDYAYQQENTVYHPPRGASRDHRGGAAYQGQPPRGPGTPRGAAPPNAQGRPVNGSGRGGHTQQRRQPPPNSPPQQTSWDNPFPGFPGAQKKTSLSEEQKIMSSMAGLDVGQPRRPGTAGGSRPPNRGDFGNGRGMPPSSNRGNYGQRPLPGAAQGPRSQSRGLPPARIDTSGNPRSDMGYGHPMSATEASYGPPSRSATMPNEVILPPRNQSVQQNYPRYPAEDTGPGLPYSGYAGKAPPRPSTAGGNRPPPQRMYPPEPRTQHEPRPLPPPQSQPEPQQLQSNLAPSRANPDWAKSVHIEHLYDDYFDTQQQQRDSGASYNSGQGSPPRGGPSENTSSRMPPRQQVNNTSSVSRMQAQPDFRAQVQPQSAVYEMVGDAPPIPDGFPPHGARDQQYDQYGYDRYDQRANDNGYDDYSLDAQSNYHNTSSAREPMLANPPAINGNPAVRRPGTSDGQNQRGPVMSVDPYTNNSAPARAAITQTPAPNMMAANKPAPVRNYGTSVTQPAPITLPPLQRQPTTPTTPATTSPITLAELNSLRVSIKAQPNDAATHLKFAKKLMEAVEVITPQIPDARKRAKEREKYQLEAHKILKRLCAGVQPNPDAQFFLADCVGRGAFGLESDNKEAFSLYQGAAKSGHAAAAYRTAVCCELGNEDGGGTRKDPEKAIQWYQRAATLGDVPAMYKLGIIMQKGLLGQQKDLRAAIGWLKRATEFADVENPHAVHELALIYEAVQPSNAPILQDEAYALSLFEQGAKLGYRFSQFRLGCAYEYGTLGLAISPRESIMWYSRAAVQDEHQSELALSGWYLTGSEGILGQSDTEAYLWARKSALAGLAKAEYAMGYYTETGIGAPSDLEAAKRWYWRAAAQNFPQARARLEELKKGGAKPIMKTRERHSRSRVGKQNEGECAIM